MSVNFFDLKNQYINPSSKTHFCLMLIYYGKPITQVAFTGNDLHTL